MEADLLDHHQRPGSLWLGRGAPARVGLDAELEHELLDGQVHSSLSSFERHFDLGSNPPPAPLSAWRPRAQVATSVCSHCRMRALLAASPWRLDLMMRSISYVTRIARWGLVGASAVVLMLAPSVNAAAAPRGVVHVVYATPKVTQDGILTVRALVVPRGRVCALSLRGPSKQLLKLPNRRDAATGHLQWRYRIPRSAPTGRWLASVSCHGGTHSHRFFSVGARPLPARVVVLKSGFTQSGTGVPSGPSGTSGVSGVSGTSGIPGSFISYGVVLQNTTKDADALGVTVHVSFEDTLGRSITSDETQLTGIPAGQRFYVSGLASSNVSLAVAKMQVSVKVHSTQSPKLVLPPMKNIATHAGTFGEAVTGTIADAYAKPIPSSASIYLVYLDPSGNVVGGASEELGAAVEPDNTVEFGVNSISSNIGDPIPAASVATIDASIDPCDDFAPGCPAQVPASALQ